MGSFEIGGWGLLEAGHGNSFVRLSGAVYLVEYLVKFQLLSSTCGLDGRKLLVRDALCCTHPL